MSAECRDPLQCAFIHEVRSEITEVNTKLTNLCITVHSIFEALTNFGANVSTTPQLVSTGEMQCCSTERSFDAVPSVNSQNAISIVKEEPINIEDLNFEDDKTLFTFGNRDQSTFVGVHDESANFASTSIDGSHSKDTEYLDSQKHSKASKSRKKTKQKVKGKVYCSTCKIGVWRASWLKHVASKHLSTPALTCQLCGFKTKWNTANMREHYSSSHNNMKMQFDDRRDELKKEIYKLSKDLMIENF